MFGNPEKSNLKVDLKYICHPEHSCLGEERHLAKGLKRIKKFWALLFVPFLVRVYWEIGIHFV